LRKGGLLLLQPYIIPRKAETVFFISFGEKGRGILAYSSNHGRDIVVEVSIPLKKNRTTTSEK